MKGLLTIKRGTRECSGGERQELQKAATIPRTKGKGDRKKLRNSEKRALNCWIQTSAENFRLSPEHAAHSTVKRKLSGGHPLLNHKMQPVAL